MFSAIVTIFILCPAQQAFAHATPVRYEPEASAVMERAPQQILIRFSENVEKGSSSIRVLGPDGMRVDGNDAEPNPADEHDYRASINATASGTYTVAWQVVSADDGHFTKGAYSFSVGVKDAAAEDTAQFQVVHSSTVREAFAIGLELLGQAVLLGMLAAIVLLSFARKSGIDVPAPTSHRLTALVAVGTALIIVGALLYLVIKATDLSKLQEVSFFTAFQQFLSTTAGGSAAYRGALGMLFLLVFVPFRKVIRRAVPGAILLSIVLLAMLLRAKVSHAAASEWMPVFSVGMNFLHVIGKSLWVGSLIALIFLTFPFLERLKDIRMFARFLTYSSKLFTFSFGITAITGLYIIWLHLKEPGNVGNSLWGYRFLYLSGYAAVFVLFRLYHHFVVNTVAVHASSGSLPPSRGKYLRGAGVTMIIEMLLGIVVLFFSSALIITTPPLTHAPVILAEAQSQEMRLRLSQYPYDDKLLLLTAEGRKADIAAIQDVSLVLTNEQESIGPIVAKTEKRFDGGYVFPLSELSLPGQWKLDVTFLRPASYDAAASFRLDYPVQLQQAAERSAGRTFGVFELLLLLAVVVALIFTWFLYRYATRLEQMLGEPSAGAIPIPVMAFGKLWGSALLIGFVIFLLVGFHVQSWNTWFRDACRSDGFYWHENVPMRAAKATSNTAVLGCMMGFGKGMFHIADAQEFAYFDRPAIAIASLRAEPSEIVTGTPTKLVFQIRDGNGQPVQELSAAHDRLLHIVIASDDFSVFDHIHVENVGPITEEMLKTAIFPATYTFPKAGRYIVAIDFTVRAQQFMQEFYLNVGGSPKTGDAPLIDAAMTQAFDGYAVTLQAPKAIRPMNTVRLIYTFEKDGKPVTDIQPYLAAPMHIAVMRDDQRHFTHVHGQLPRTLLDRLTNLTPPTHVHMNMPDKFGPNIEASLMFPAPGRYVLFGEFKHQGKRVVTKFAVEVR